MNNGAPHWWDSGPHLNPQTFPRHWDWVECLYKIWYVGPTIILLSLSLLCGDHTNNGPFHWWDSDPHLISKPFPHHWDWKESLFQNLVCGSHDYRVFPKFAMWRPYK